MATFFSCYFWWFLLGLIMGLILCWLYDKFFWRGNTSAQALSRNDDDATLTKIALLESENKSLLDQIDNLRSVTEAKYSSKTAMDAAVKLGFAPLKNGRDNLTVVEGIGPKISELLYKNGINTFAQLAATEVSVIQGILNDAGKSFQLAKPESWPKQAKMCADGDWEALKRYQDKLVNGIEFD